MPGPLFLMLLAKLASASAEIQPPVSPGDIPSEPGILPSDPQSPALLPELDPIEGPFVDVLEEARSLGGAGRAREAMKLLDVLELRIRSGEEVPDELGAHALVLLAARRFETGDRDGALRTFQYLASRYPGREPSPYDHPLSLIALYDEANRGVESETEDSHRSGWDFAPLGIPQFMEHRPGAGIAFGGLQLAMGGLSVATWLALNESQGEVDVPNSMAQEAFQERRWVQWASTAAFWGAYVGSVIDARQAWGRPVAVGLSILPDGAYAGVMVRR